MTAHPSLLPTRAVRGGPAASPALAELRAARRHARQDDAAGAAERTPGPAAASRRGGTAEVIPFPRCVPSPPPAAARRQRRQRLALAATLATLALVGALV